MNEIVSPKSSETLAEPGEKQPLSRRQDKMTWETPLMEDVSEQVMAQPYIRFT